MVFLILFADIQHQKVYMDSMQHSFLKETHLILAVYPEQAEDDPKKPLQQLMPLLTFSF